VVRLVLIQELGQFGLKVVCHDSVL
jgi:hypothetical protein